MRKKPDACKGCPAYNVGRGFVPAHPGPAAARIALVGQGPGEEEAWAGTPFVGKSGKVLGKWLARSGIKREECHVSNVVWCWLPKNRAPKPEEVSFCREAHWGPALAAKTDLQVTVPIGIPASTALIGQKTNMDWAGRLLETEAGTIIPILHPAFILRGKWEHDPAQVIYLKRAKAYAAGWRPQTLTVPTGFEAPQFKDMVLWESEMRRSGEGCAVDIETAGDHIRLVGLAHLAPPHRPLVVPFRTKGGQPYWSSLRDLHEVVGWLWSLLADPTVLKVFHNGQAFDVPILERNGFVVEGYEFDTMLAQHICYPGMDKDLEFIAKLYLGSSGWKHLVKGKKDKDEGEGK